MRRVCCTYHCRSCGGHFTSLEAFDAHRQEARCTYPDEIVFLEQLGDCDISDAKPRKGVTVHSVHRPGQYGEAPQGVQVKVSGGAA